MTSGKTSGCACKFHPRRLGARSLIKLRRELSAEATREIGEWVESGRGGRLGSDDAAEGESTEPVDTAQ